MVSYMQITISIGIRCGALESILCIRSLPWHTGFKSCIRGLAHGVNAGISTQYRRSSAQDTDLETCALHIQ
jgi:hypothetical protein